MSTFLGDPIVLGLTATPPDPMDVDEEDFDRYTSFLGEVDYEVPVPALVRDGNLAPYQDLAYFVRPTASEVEYIAGVREGFHETLSELAAPRDREQEPGRLPGLDDWLEQVFAPPASAVWHSQGLEFIRAERPHIRSSGEIASPPARETPPSQHP